MSKIREDSKIFHLYTQKSASALLLSINCQSNFLPPPTLCTICGQAVDRGWGGESLKKYIKC